MDMVDPDVVVGVATPVAQNLGPLGLVIVILFALLTAGLFYLLIFVLKSHRDERKEWKTDAEKREEKSVRALENLTDAIRFSNRINPNDLPPHSG